jgi:hypothetical protein
MLCCKAQVIFSIFCCWLNASNMLKKFNVLKIRSLKMCTKYVHDMIFRKNTMLHEIKI